MSAADYQINPNQKAPPMPNKLIREAMEVFSIPSTMHNETSMSLYIVKQLNRMKIPYTIDNYGNILVTKGHTQFPCFCAHLDTVHTYKNGYTLLKTKVKNRVYLHAVDDSNKRVGVGGDDKCGIFACLYLLRTLAKVKVVFFSSEESGGIGSANIDLSFFDDCQFLGGIDRWNGHDFINRYSGVHTISKEFKHDIDPLLKQYGYECTTGLFTDAFNVMERKIGLSCFNMSCGYYGHHSDQEYVDLAELYNACLLCSVIAHLTPRYLHDVAVSQFGFHYGNTYRYNQSSWGNTAWSWKDKEWDYTTKTWKQKGVKDDPEVVERVCKNCSITLFSYEHEYCTACKPYFSTGNRRYGVYDDYYD